MDAVAAAALLERLVQPAVSPALSAGEMTSLLADAAVLDADGYAPDDALWTATYGRRQVYAAAVAGISLKIAKIAVTHVAVSNDGASFNQAQAVEHLERLRAEYQRSAAGALGARSTWGLITSPIVNWNDPDAD